MALHFVSRAVLTSDDGVSFDEQAVDNADARKTRAEAQQEHKSLYAQLAARQASKDDEREASRKQALGTRALDEEDVAFFNELEKKEELRKSARAEDEEKLLESFRTAKSEAVYSALPTESASTATTILAFPPSKPEKDDLIAVTFVKKKRKAEAAPTAPAAAPAAPAAPAAAAPPAVASTDSHLEQAPQKRAAIEEPLPQPAAPPASSVLAGLADYASDDE